MKANVAMKLHAQDVNDVEEWRLLDEQIKKLTAERDAIANNFKIRMESGGHHVGMYRSQVLVEMRERVTNTIDGKRLRTEHPAIAEEYTKTSVSRKPHYVS